VHDGYSIELKTSTVLQGLGFKTADFERPTETFSGGWQMRIALAKLLLGQPNLLLLDEPTNHLDLEARNWLEEYLNAYPHAVILVSHDRFFLDAVVTRIADLTLRTLTDYHTTYSGYLLEHHERIEALRKAKREQDEEVARVKMFIDRFRYQATKAAQVQSRIKLLEKVVPIEVPVERKKIHFDFPACAKSGRMVLELKRAAKAYNDIVVFKDLSLHIERGDRIALVGPNGVGKSTLMRMLSGEEAPGLGRAHARPQRRDAVLSRRTKRRAWIRRRRCTKRWRPDRPADGADDSGTSSADSCSPATTSTSTSASCPAASARASPWRGCCSVRRTRCCSTSRPTTSISIRRKCCSTRWWTTAAR
jgi:ATPase subunit of ABC transporter with duplicated ATPase domains